MKVNFIYTGDTLEVLRTFPDECVDCIITSPPYHGLRDYGIKGQIGLESTLEEYLEKMLAVTSELKRVLKKSGTMFWNHGDSYGANWRGGIRESEFTIEKFRKKKPWQDFYGKTGKITKCLSLQNFRLAQRMVDEQGWILRNIIIWHKPNCMPSSVKDRFTVDYEPIFFFTRSKEYWFETQYEPQQTKSFEPRLSQHRAWDNDPTLERGKGEGSIMKYNPLGRNKRCVWKIPAHPFSEAHFATFPEKLIEPMVKAGCPENGVCLDPFMGSGTTAVVSRKLGRNYVGIELNKSYIEIAERRLSQQTLL